MDIWNKEQISMDTTKRSNRWISDKRFGLCKEACQKGMLFKNKPRAFTNFAKRYGEEELLNCLERNEEAGQQDQIQPEVEFTFLFNQSKKLDITN